MKLVSWRRPYCSGIYVCSAMNFLASLCFIVPAAVRAADDPAAFQTAIRPLMQTYCFKCHGAEEPEGDVNLSDYKDTAGVQLQSKVWQKVLRALREGQMPPPKKTQPKQDERDRIVNWVQHTLNSIDDSKIPKDPGYVVFHRLSRLEYNNTIRDLFGVTTNPADNFPADGGGGGGFDNNADTLFIHPILMENYLRASREILNAADPSRIFIARANSTVSNRQAAEIILRHFAPLAFRHPAQDPEIQRLMGLFDQAGRNGKSFEDAVKLALRAVLISPHFLFRTEIERGAEPYRVTDYELAARMSYFIWSSMPDEELFALAAKNKLHEPAELEKQVSRMVADSKAHALAENFGTQWLEVKSLKTTAQPDLKRFPTFTPALRDAMYDEPVAFFAALLRENRSLVELLDSDYTFVNEELARHYGIPGVTGSEFRKVKLPDSQRGGVLAMAAVLTHTSYTLRTSPVLRGKWVLEEILGEPPPPPPPQAGVLPQDDALKEGKSLRERLEAHRSKKECASCHARMDPLGFGLENFDPIGHWRTTIAEKPVDASGVLTTGEKFNGPSELKKLLLPRKEDFARTLTEKMMAYALGRGLEYFDQPSIRKICKALASNDYRSKTLVAGIVMSYPFQYRRSVSEDDVKKIPAKDKPK